MYNFCTLFDTNYLSRGVALYRSLERTCDSFHLYIFAFDDRTHAVLKSLNLKHATVISLHEFEDEALLSVKPMRSRAEYCWTATSSTILFVLNRYNVDICTYLDADMLFFDSPKVLFDEMGEASITITEHRYSPQYNKQKKSGKYCVQYVSVRNDERGLLALRWWKDRCIEWCYARYEDGKFGDQKYLDDWTTRFEGVHELQNLGGGVAAWNIQQYEVLETNQKPYILQRSTGLIYPVIFYHFHHVRFYTDGSVDLGRRKLSKDAVSYIYQPYFRWLDEAKKEISKVDSSIDSHGASDLEWKTQLLYLYRKAGGIYNVYPMEVFDDVNKIHS